MGVLNILSLLFLQTGFNDFYADYENPEKKIITLMYF